MQFRITQNSLLMPQIIINCLALVWRLTITRLLCAVLSPKHTLLVISRHSLSNAKLLLLSIGSDHALPVERALSMIVCAQLRYALSIFLLLLPCWEWKWLPLRMSLKMCAFYTQRRKNWLIAVNWWWWWGSVLTGLLLG